MALRSIAVAAACAAVASGGKTITVTNGYVGKDFVGTHTSMLTANVLSMFEAVTADQWVSGS